jgi:hypothetical protein
MPDEASRAVQIQKNGKIQKSQRTRHGGAGPGSGFQLRQTETTAITRSSDFSAVVAEFDPALLCSVLLRFAQ